MQVIRPEAVAGTFYPAQEAQLRHTLELLFEATKSKSGDEKIFALIAPHAGYAYSGITAAFAYNKIAGKDYNCVIVISPSHRE
ncbi:MAG: AmmeMemoRadiSam system protein B, partial [Ignavibacteria bacterium]